ncbi:MAG: S46 family peptidase [Hyphomonadaceae bacterium]
MRQKLRAAIAALGLLALASAPASSEEGHWTFDNIPAARMQQELGWAPDRSWLDRVMAATARIPGCSASNVSGEGLLLTNHHCVLACIGMLSSAQSNYISDGFMARTRDEELRCPGMIVQVLAGIEDVTAAIETATAGATPETFARLRDGEIARLTRACSAGATRCEVVTLYDGGRYALHRYTRYDDVRLVFAPEQDMAAFGGEADNFQFPRYCLDVAFLRVYQNGAPAATPRHLRLRFTPPEDGEIVLIAGNPGPTSRTRTVSELRFERDVGLPWQIQAQTALRDRLVSYAALGPDQMRVAAPAIETANNTLGALVGRRAALQSETGMARVVARETDLRTRVNRNLAAVRDIADAWGEIERAQTARRRLFDRYTYLEQSAGEHSQLFAWARDIVRAGAERQKPAEQRLARYTDARLALLGQNMRTPRYVEPALEEAYFAAWLAGLQRDLSGDAALMQRVFGGESPEALAARLAQSSLSDPVTRAQVWDGGADAVAASSDPLIAFVRAWDDDARQARAAYVSEVEAPVARAQERIARARFRAFGTSHYPDATFSPRISYGRVAGWIDPEQGLVDAFTHLSALYDRATGAQPFVLSQRWIDARAALDGELVYNFATSTDVIGGNSGSPVLDRDGRVIGTVFDGNIHSLGGEFFYDPDLNRSVAVSSALIRTALRDVYGMDSLLAELEAE